MAVFRIEKTRDYTVMSNHHLRDQGLSLKAKGLLSMMLSLPEEWNYTTRGLASICKEGTDSIGSALKELERTGYIVRNRLRDSKGKILDVEYVIYETPHPAAEPDTAAPDTACPHPENPDMDIPCLEKPSQLNIDRESNYPSKKDSVNTDRQNPILSNPPTPAGARMGRDGMGWMSEKPIGRSFWRTSIMTFLQTIPRLTGSNWTRSWRSFWTRSVHPGKPSALPATISRRRWSSPGS